MSRAARAWCAAALACLLALAACQQRPAPRVIDVPTAAVRLRVPQEWREEPSPGTLLFLRPVARGQVIRGAFMLLARDVAREGVTPSLGDYVALKEREAAAAARTYSALEDRNLQIGVGPARLIERRTEDRLEARRALALHWLDGAAGYSLVASAPEGEFPRVRAEFERVLLGVEAGNPR